LERASDRVEGRKRSVGRRPKGLSVNKGLYDHREIGLGQKGKTGGENEKEVECHV